MDTKNKHLTYDNRLDIERGLKERLSFKQIGKNIGKDCTTIPKEIKNHIKITKAVSPGRQFNDCISRKHCEFRYRNTTCSKEKCTYYQKEFCEKLNKAPYVCNGCPLKRCCTLEKHEYDAAYAQKEYEETLKESRTGITFNEKEIENLNNILVPLIVDKGQSIHNACINNQDKIMTSEREIYYLIKNEVINIKSIDLPRTVQRRLTKKRKTYYKIDKKCLIDRKHEDFLKFKMENKDLSIVEMDTVEGIKGGKCLLTIHFVNCNFMLAFIREHNDAQSVIDVFNFLQNIWGINLFKKMFGIILTDNGSEFSDPTKIEFDPNTGEQRTHIFYCEPGRSDQKGSCENNHELIRRILPKETSFDNLTQDDINKMMSHINSYKRKALNDCSPLQLFSTIYGKDIAIKIGITKIKNNEIILSKKLFK